MVRYKGRAVVMTMYMLTRGVDIHGYDYDTDHDTDDDTGDDTDDDTNDDTDDDTDDGGRGNLYPIKAQGSTTLSGHE